jgi:hypothetical protein
MAFNVPHTRSLAKGVAACRNSAGSELPIETSLRMAQNGSVKKLPSFESFASRPSTSVHGRFWSVPGPIFRTSAWPEVSALYRWNAPG